MAAITAVERRTLRDMLSRGVLTHYWVTRNFKVRGWDDTESYTRLLYPPAPGIAMIQDGEEVERFVPQYVEDVCLLGDVIAVHRKYLTMSAESFVDSIVSFC